MSLGPVAVSYILAALSVPVVLKFHLLPAVFAGLAVHVLTIKLACRLSANWGGLAHKVSLATIVIIVMLGLTGFCLGIWSFFHSGGGMAALLATVAETLKKLQGALPDFIAAALPDTTEDWHEPFAEMVQEHSRKISAVGVAGVKTIAHVLLGMVIGGMTALHHFDGIESWPPFAVALHARCQTLAGAFDKMVFAQVKISALNTLFTALYLLVVLPLCGVHLPLSTVLIPLTFVTGLLPVVGNLISNTAIVLISFGISPRVAVASFGFLVVIHKLEYFTNARIVGGEAQARAWEMLCAMMGMEAVFGLPGLIAAPVVYAWLKAEIRAKDVI